TFSLPTSTTCAQYTIGVIVDGYYTRNASADNDVVTVQRASAGSIGGGGFVVNSGTAGAAVAGSYKPDVGAKTNFGLNVKFNKSGTNLQGAVNMILRRTVGGVLRTYQIKSNAIASLSTSGSSSAGLKATFTSKANMTDITDPLNPVPVASVGNGQL